MVPQDCSCPMVCYVFHKHKICIAFTLVKQSILQNPQSLYVHAFQLCQVACTPYPNNLHSQSKLVIGLCISVFFQALQSLVQQCSSTYFLPLVDSLYCWSPSRHCCSGSCSYLEASYNLCWCSCIL